MTRFAGLLYDVRRDCSRHPNFSAAGRRDRVRHLQLERALTGHTGCINSIEFSPDASLLITGSDDTNVCLYDTLTWERRAILSTAHMRNIFNAVMVPGSGNRELLSCGLDGRTCLLRVPEGSSTLAEAEVVQKSILVRDNSISSRIVFMACDPRTAYVSRSTGSVAVVDLRLEREVDEFAPFHRDLTRSSNTIAASPIHPYLLACGSDLPPVALVDVRCLRREDASFLKIATPLAMQSSGIGGMSFSSSGSKIVCSYKSSDVFVYDWTTTIEHADRRRVTGADVVMYPRHDLASQFTVCESKRYVGRTNRLTMFKEATFFDNDRFVVTGGDCGHVFVWDTVTTKLVRRVKGDSDIVNGVLTHPSIPAIIACGIDDTAKVISHSADRVTGCSSTKNGDGSAGSSATPHRFSPPRTRHRFAAESDDDDADEVSDDEQDSIGGSNDDHADEEFATDASSDDEDHSDSTSDSESMSLRANARAVAILQLQLLQGDIPVRSELLPHLRMTARLMRTATTGADVFDLSDEDEDDDDNDDDSSEEMGEEDEDEEEEEGEEAEGEEGEGEEGEENDDGEGDGEARTGAARSRDSVSAGVSDRPQPSIETTSPSDDDDEEDEDSPGFASAALHPLSASSRDILGLLLFALQKYRRYLDQVRNLCARNNIIGAHEGKVRLNTAVPARMSIQFGPIWQIFNHFADIVFDALDHKFVLAYDDATKETWITSFTEVCLIKAQIACSEGEPDRALAHLSNGATQTTWSVPLLTATVAVAMASESASALVATRLAQLKDVLRATSTAGGATTRGGVVAPTSEQRQRARKLIRAAQGLQGGSAPTTPATGPAAPPAGSTPRSE